MKKYLYEIDITSGGATWHFQGIPFMPKVLAEKQAKAMNRAVSRLYPGRRFYRYTVSKTGIETRDTTPHGFMDYDEYRARKIAE